MRGRGVEREMYYLFVFRSLTETERGARAISSARIRSTIVNTPAKLSADGCSRAVKVGAMYAGQAKRVLAARRLYPVRVYAVDNTGAREVRFIDIP